MRVTRPDRQARRRAVRFLIRRGREGWWKTYAVAAFLPLLKVAARVLPALSSWIEEHELLYRLRYYTLVDYPRVRSLYALAGAVLGRVRGAVVECGVWRGGSAALFAVQARRNGADGTFWLFDSFEGLPEPGPEDVTFTGQVVETGSLTGSIDAVRELLFGVLGMDPSCFEIVKGWFKDTIPVRLPEIGPVALLHIDCDFEAPTTLCLEALYPLVEPGGAVVIDDYHYFRGSRKAVDAFREKHGITAELIPTDRFGVYWKKDGAAGVCH